MSRSCRTALSTGCLLLTVGLAEATVDLEFINIPEAARPQQTLDIDFSWTKTAGEEEQLLIFLLQVKDAGTDDLLTSVRVDNNGNGVAGTAGMESLAIQLPDIETSVYFELYASPWSLNKQVVNQLESYPTDGTWTYQWSGGGYGVTQDLIYQGSLIAPKPTGDTTYCSGIAFEVGFLAAQQYNASYGSTSIGGLSASDMRRFRQVWYGTLAYPDPELKLAALAIPQEGLGLEITDFEKVQKGDFCQLWRHSGSGHNPIFINWIRNNSDEITGLRYWGSQSSTNGIGYRNEYFGVNSGIDPERIFFGRMQRPEGQGDIDFALNSVSTSEQPLLIIDSNDSWVLR